MAPERQEICRCRWKKFTNALNLGINQSCSNRSRVQIILCFNLIIIIWLCMCISSWRRGTGCWCYHVSVWQRNSLQANATVSPVHLHLPAGSTKWCIEGQAFSLVEWFGSYPTPSVPLRQQIVSPSQSSSVSLVEFTDGRGRGRVRAKLCDGEKAWSSKNHLIISACKPWLCGNTETTCPELFFYSLWPYFVNLVSFKQLTEGMNQQSCI